MNKLQDAYTALKTGDLKAAQSVTAELLKSDVTNAQAWFILSESVTGERKELFYNKAISIDPDVAQSVSQFEIDSAEPEIELAELEFEDVLDEVEPSISDSDLIEEDPVDPAQEAGKSADEIFSDLFGTDSADSSTAEPVEDEAVSSKVETNEKDSPLVKAPDDFAYSDLLEAETRPLSTVSIEELAKPLPPNPKRKSDNSESSAQGLNLNTILIALTIFLILIVGFLFIRSLF